MTFAEVDDAHENDRDDHDDVAHRNMQVGEQFQENLGEKRN